MFRVLNMHTYLAYCVQARYPTQVLYAHVKITSRLLILQVVMYRVYPCYEGCPGLQCKHFHSDMVRSVIFTRSHVMICRISMIMNVSMSQATDVYDLGEADHDLADVFSYYILYQVRVCNQNNPPSSVPYFYNVF